MAILDPVAAPLAGRLAARPRRPARRVLARAAGPSLAATYLSILVLLPMVAVFSRAFSGGPGAFWRTITEPQVANALELTVISAAIVVVVNSIAGVAVAWLLVRDRFPLAKVVGALVDLPFALPTVIAGITLVSLYGPHSPLHADLAYTRLAVLVALAFVTLPFSVRSVQPVLAALDRETEEAAASLGATSFTTFRRIVLPSLAPALLTGAGLGFARALGEYGSVTIVSGNLPMKTEVASVAIFGFVENSDLPAAAATSLALFALALVALLVFGGLRRHLVRGEGE